MARKFTRPAPGNRYSDAERRAWGAEQDRLRALRNAPGYQKPPPPKRQTRAKTLVADTSGSTCFDDLRYSNGVVSATFANPTQGTWEYEMSLSEARAWFKSEDGLGEYFNENIR